MANEAKELVSVGAEAVPVVIDQSPVSLLGAIVTLAKDPHVDVTKLKSLMEMQTDMEERERERKFNEAYSRLSGQLPRVKKNGTIDLGKGKPIPFARWEDMDAVIRPLMAAEGFSLRFNSFPRDGGGAEITGKLIHIAGHKEPATVYLPLDAGPGRNNLQAMGSTISYGKRYVAEMLLNIVREGQDDDGHASGQRFVTPEQADELRVMLAEAGRQEGPFLAKMFGGNVRSMEEVEVGGAYQAVKNTLAAVIQQKGAAR